MSSSACRQMIYKVRVGFIRNGISLSHSPGVLFCRHREVLPWQLRKIRQTMADASTLRRPTRYFHPIQDAVPEEYLLRISDRLFTAELNENSKGESSDSENDQAPSLKTYNVKPNQFNQLLPGLSWDEKSKGDTGGWPDLLCVRHPRVHHIHEYVLAQANRREVELGDQYYYPVIVAALILWSDGLNPNTSTTNNRGSVWLLLGTLVLNWGKANPGSYTYPLAVGPAVCYCSFSHWQKSTSDINVFLQSEDHEEVFVRVNAQVLFLLPHKSERDKIMFYSREAKCMVNLYLRLFVHLADQPERREITSVMAGNGSYTGYWGWSLLLSKVRKFLPPCKVCREKLFSEDDISPFWRKWNEVRCDKCTQ